MDKKSLDEKIVNIHTNSATDDFILVDAKDPDSAFGILSTGKDRNGENKSKQEFLNDIQVLVNQAIIDIVVTSINTYGRLVKEKDIFSCTTVTPAIRMNASSDIWQIRGGSYNQLKSLPYTCLNPDRFILGQPQLNTNRPSVDLGLYSITFNNNPDDDLRSLEAFKSFWISAEQNNFRYFLEVFDPNSRDSGLTEDEIPGFINDHIARLLSIIPISASPLFLKVPYHGPDALQELVKFDQDLIIGILGGSSGTTYDAFKLISEVQKYGARAAIFGRRIKDSEHPPTFVHFLDSILKKEINPENAVLQYHDEIKKIGIAPFRSFEIDSKISTSTLRYLLS